VAVAAGSISDGLSADFYGSTLGVVSPSDLGATQVALDGRQYLIDLTRYSRTILDSQAPQQDAGAEPGEQSLSRSGYWTRQQTDWSGGAGQEIFDDASSSRSRFFSSVGLEVFDRRRLSLLHDTALRIASSATNLKVFAVDRRLYLVDGQHIRHTDDPDVSTPVTVDVDCSLPITDVTTDGDRIYIARGATNGILVMDVGGNSATAFGSETPDLVEYVNGRLMAAEGNELYELAADGTVVGGSALMTDPRTDAKWVAITGTPQAIFAAVNAGDVAEVYATTVDDQSGALLPPTYAGGLPWGETIRCMAAYPPGNLVVIGTDRGIRVAIADGAQLLIGERIDIDGGVNDVDLRDRFCWFTWSNVRIGATGLGRLDLSRSISDATFVPAWAEDLAADTTGEVTGVTTLRRAGGARDRRYFTVAGVGLYGETDELVEQGSLETGQIRFGILPNKVFTSVEIRHEDTLGSIGAALTFDDGSSAFIGGGPTTGGTRMVLDSGGNAGLSASLALMLTRDDNDPTQGPVVRAWALSALPQPPRVVEIILPIVLHTKVQDLRGHERTFRPLAEVQRLERLASSSQLVVYQEGADTRRVRVASVAIPDGGVRSWSRDGEPWLETIVYVRLLCKEA